MEREGVGSEEGRVCVVCDLGGFVRLPVMPAMPAI
jgi:hypothetical protein